VEMQNVQFDLADVDRSWKFERRAFAANDQTGKRDYYEFSLHCTE